MKKPNPPLPKLLKQKIVIADAEGGDVAMYISEEKKRRKLALIEHYKIPSDLNEHEQNKVLLDALLTQFITGFQVSETPPRGRGRPSRWFGIDGVRLSYLVDTELRAQEHRGGKLPSTKRICEKLIKKGYFHSDESDSLEARYNQLKKFRSYFAALYAFGDKKEIDGIARRHVKKSKS